MGRDGDRQVAQEIVGILEAKVKALNLENEMAYAVCVRYLDSSDMGYPIVQSSPNQPQWAHRLLGIVEEVANQDVILEEVKTNSEDSCVAYRSFPYRIVVVVSCSDSARRDEVLKAAEAHVEAHLLR